jgi:hypothetical protein
MTVPHMVGLERIRDYKGVGVEGSHACTACTVFEFIMYACMHAGFN